MRCFWQAHQSSYLQYHCCSEIVTNSQNYAPVDLTQFFYSIASIKNDSIEIKLICNNINHFNQDQ